MKKIILCIITMTSLLGSAFAESVKIAPAATTKQADNGIEVGDSEAHRIQKQNENLYFFIGGNMKGVLPLYWYDYDNDLENNTFAYGFGLETGVKFRKDKYIYHPGLRLVYEKIYNSGTFEHSYSYYNTDTTNMDITHTIYGAMFDNYFRIAHNQPSIIGGYNVNDFFVLSLGYGKINVEYDAAKSQYSFEDKGNTWILDLGYLSQFDNGLGITFDAKYYFPDIKTVDVIFSFELGLRYSF